MTSPTSDIHYWRCPNCGQVHFGDTPPDMCAVCDDFTTWQPLSDQVPAPNGADLETDGPVSPDDRPVDRQLPLFGD